MLANVAIHIVESDQNQIVQTETIAVMTIESSINTIKQIDTPKVVRLDFTLNAYCNDQLAVRLNEPMNEEPKPVKRRCRRVTLNRNSIKTMMNRKSKTLSLKLLLTLL